MLHEKMYILWFDYYIWKLTGALRAYSRFPCPRLKRTIDRMKWKNDYFKGIWGIADANVTYMYVSVLFRNKRVPTALLFFYCSGNLLRFEIGLNKNPIQ